MVMEKSYKLRIIGVLVFGPSLMFGDNMSMILICALLSRTLKKKHNAVAYHYVRGYFSSGFIKLAHARSDNDFSDILTK